jgi:hypothetical protein
MSAKDEQQFDGLFMTAI